MINITFTDRTHFMYPFTSGWAVGLFSLLGCDEQCCYEHFVQIFVWTHIFISPGVELLSHVGTFWEIAKLFFHSDCTIFTFWTAVNKGCTFFTALSVLVILFHSSHPSGYKGVTHFGVNLHFPNDWVMLNIFLCAYGHLYIFFEKCLFKFFAHFLLGYLPF